MDGIWITWEHQRRNLGISSALGFPLFEVVYTGSRLWRYLRSSIRTVYVIYKAKPKIIIAQNPSILLAIIIVILKNIFKYKAIIDAHNSGIYPMEGKNRALMTLAHWLQKHADLTIVTNERLHQIVEGNSGRAFILPDRLPQDIPKVKPFPVEGNVSIAFICTYSVDEPYLEVIKAAELIPDNVVIYVTGKYSGKVDNIKLPKNIKLLGFIPNEEFWSLLCSVNIIMDLTLREGCLVCGAYEGLALIKPLILSDTLTIRQYFSKGCVYVKPTARSIADGICELIRNKEYFESNIIALEKTINSSWNDTFQKFLKILNAL